MPTTAAPMSSGLEPLLAALRASFVAVAGVFVVAALALAALAAAIVGVLIAFAAVVLRVRPRRKQVSQTLEGRKTAAGWVVEAPAR